jgi:selT/selW/selH-like putative selenoprotein
LAASIAEEFAVDSELIRGADGIFDVVVDGELIFSKHQENRFPEAPEILETLRTRA